MRPDPIDEEIQRRQWERFWATNPDADPIKVMCGIVCVVATVWIIMWSLLLFIAVVAMLSGVI